MASFNSGPFVAVHPADGISVETLNTLYAAAAAGTHSVAHAIKLRLRRHVGATLRPGLETPLWNALVDETRPLLRRRGSKAQLARLLGVPRQRLQDCLKAKTACLDAERTLLLLCWICSEQQRRKLLL